MNKPAKILFTVLASAAIGAAVGVLFAPDEGTETRRKIVKRGKKLVGAVNDSIDESRDTLEEVSSLLQKQLHRINDRLEELS